MDGQGSGPRGRSAPEDRADRVWRRLHALAHEYDVRRGRASTALGLSETRVEALRLVAAAPQPPTMGELAARLHTDRPYVSVVVDELERHGLVARLRHPTDRRVRIVSVTAEGRVVAARAEAMLGGFRDRLAGLDPDELATLERAVELLEPRGAGRGAA
jgi:DNA-binding MarR family transcriptional regulator